MNHKIESTSNFHLIVFFILIAFSCQSCISAKDRSIKEWETLEEKNPGWEIIKVDKNDEPTWIIYARKIAGTNFLEYKIEGEVKSSSKACVSVFKEDIHTQANDLSNKKYPTYDILEESKDSLLTYVIHKEPFPLKDTEMRIRYIFFNDEEGSTGVRWHETWDDWPVQPTKKLSRVQSFRGSWNFSSTSDNACKAMNVVKFDPGKMPLWLVKPMVFNFLKKGLEDMREMAATQQVDI